MNLYKNTKSADASKVNNRTRKGHSKLIIIVIVVVVIIIIIII